MGREKVYDLEERTYLFARDCRLLIKNLPKTISNIEDGKQLVRSSGSVGANYIEANEKLGDKDLNPNLKSEISPLIQEIKRIKENIVINTIKIIRFSDLGFGILLFGI